MRYLSLFSGIGGFELGIQRAFDNELTSSSAETRQTELDKDLLQMRQRKAVSEVPRSTRRFGATGESDLLQLRNEPAPLCIGYSEIDKYAIKVYERQFNGHTNTGDATIINPNDLPDFDLLVGGFPCQAFSVAGKRAGFNDTRGTLFFDIARILKHKRPRHLVLENVKGLLSHDQGKTFQTIIGVLADLGYRVEWQVLNSKDFGVPQNRERIYIIGHLGDGSCGQVFPLRNSHESSTKHIQRHTANTLTARYEGAQATGTYIAEGKLDAQALTERRTPEAKHLRRMGVVKDTRSLKKLEPREDGLANTVTTGDVKNQSLFTGTKVRRLTPKECERLQGFPDNWTALGIGEEPISDTQRYKMCGNAVTVNVVQAVMERLYVET